MIGGDELQQPTVHLSPGDGAPPTDGSVTGSGATEEGRAWRRDARGTAVGDGGRLVVTGQGSSSGRRSSSVRGARRASVWWSSRLTAHSIAAQRGTAARVRGGREELCVTRGRRLGFYESIAS